MDDVLIFADTERCPELRRELPLSVPDPFLYAEVGGVRHGVISRMEIPRLAALGAGVELHAPEELGSDELHRQGLTAHEVREQLVIRFCRTHGLDRAVVPAAFPLRMADVLRAAGIELEPSQSLFDDRRRAKTPSQLAGIRRAQRAAEAGMAAVAELIARAEPRADGAVVDGEVLTSERLRRTLLATFSEHDAFADELIASHGPQAAVGHESGSGPILPGEPIIVDIWPREKDSACYTDMSRTFVIGDPPAELVDYHRVTKAARDAAAAEIRPGAGARAIYDAAAAVIESAGYATARTKKPGEALDHGFYHGLGHGVGLGVHEQPMLGFAATGELAVGDVITIEPGVYRPGFGGCRIEDILLVTDDGAELLTAFPYELTR
jgi:Xaa-Pro aminopeptidase